MKWRVHWIFFGVFIGVGVFVFLSLAARAASYTEVMGKSDCLVCHTAETKLVGPSFSEIAAKYSSKTGAIEALVHSVKNGSTGKWGAVAMPPHPTLSDAEMTGMVKLILNESAAKAPEAPASPAKVKSVPSDEDIKRGLAIFQGTQRLKNNGPACNSCHHVKNDAVIGGGVLAKDLTTVFSRVSGQGVKAILGSPPFPVMERAYRDKPITDDENRALVAFLRHSDEQHFYQEPRDYGLRLFYSGLVGLAILFVFYGLLSLRRKKRSVNHDIYARQEQQLAE